MNITTRIAILFVVSLGIGLLALKWKGRSPIIWTLIPFLAGMVFPGLALLTVLLLAIMSKATKGQHLH